MKMRQFIFCATICGTRIVYSKNHLAKTLQKSVIETHFVSLHLLKIFSYSTFIWTLISSLASHPVINFKLFEWRVSVRVTRFNDFLARFVDIYMESGHSGFANKNNRHLARITGLIFSLRFCTDQKVEPFKHGYHTMDGTSLNPQMCLFMT